MPAPYGQQPDPNHEARLLLGLIPEEVRKSASAAQLNARFTQARKLAEQANDGRLDPLLRSQAKMMAQRVFAEPVRKAAAKDDPVPVFDANGNLIGICDPGDIQAVAGAGGRKVDDATAQQVAKAAGKVLVWDQWHRPYVAARGSIRENARPSAKGGLTGRRSR